MTETPDDADLRPASVFCAYARDDERFLRELRIHLSMLTRQKKIAVWYDRLIEPGAEWESEIDQQIETADLILLLMSPSFIHSDYCYGKEQQIALRRHNEKQARIIPIILRPCEWKETELAKIQALPRDGEPISRWADPDEAWFDVTRGVRRAVDALKRGDAGQGVPLLPDESPSNAATSASPFVKMSQDLGALVRRIRVEWSAEHTSSPLQLDGAKELLGRSAQDLMDIRASPTVDDRPFLHRSMDQVIGEMKKLERHKTWMDEFHYKEFWWLGYEVMERLDSISRATKTMVERGIDPADGESLDRLLGQKACPRLAVGNSRGFGSTTGPDWVTVDVPVRNDGRSPADEISFSLFSELDESTPSPVGVIRTLAPRQEGELQFRFSRPPQKDPPQAEDRRYRMRIAFQDELGKDVVGYSVHFTGVLGQSFRGTVIPERTIASPLCPRLFLDSASLEELS